MQNPMDEVNPLPVGNDGNFLADVNDDDGAILDSLVSSEAEPPSADDLPIVRIDMRPMPTKAVPARVVSRFRSVSIGAGMKYPILTANLWRKRALVTVSPNSTLQFARRESDLPHWTVKSDAGDFANLFFSTTTTLELHGTDELWVINSNQTACLVSVIEEIQEEVGR